MRMHRVAKQDQIKGGRTSPPCRQALSEPLLISAAQSLGDLTPASSSNGRRQENCRAVTGSCGGVWDLGKCKGVICLEAHRGRREEVGRDG
jgi:hypothetical protein